MKYIKSSSNLRTLLLAIFVGLTTGMGVWLFRRAFRGFQWLFERQLGENLMGWTLEKLAIDPRLTPVIVLTFAGVIIGWLMGHFVGREPYRGVSSVMVATWLGGGRLPYRKMPIRAVASALSLGAGASVGSNDPSVQIGANIGSFFAERFNLSEDDVRLLVASGSASAIAAAFNAPIAGVFFAIEVILIGDLTVHASGFVMLAAVMAAAFMQSVESASPVFDTPNYQLGSPFELPLHIILGVMLALFSWLVVNTMIHQNNWVRQNLKWVPLPILTGLTGALVGGIGVFVPEVLGPGEVFMNDVLNGRINYAVEALILISFVKLIATAISQSGGFVGGVFSPALFMGILLGNAFGQALILIPGINAGMIGDPTAYSIAGMAGMLAGVVQAPITSILLVFEMTNDYRMILPIMLTSVTAVFGMEYLNTTGLYLRQLSLDGINLHLDRDLDVMQGIKVREAITDSPQTIYEHASLIELRDTLRRHRARALCVINAQHQLTGVVTLGDLQRAFESGQHDDLQHVADIASQQVVTVYLDDKLWQAIQIMGERNVGCLPVLNRANHELVGMITRRQIIHTYNQAIHRKLDEHHHAEEIRLMHTIGAQVVTFEVSPEAPIAGVQIRDLQLPQNLVIASIQRDSQIIVPRGVSDIRPHDKLTVVADPEVMPQLESLFRPHATSKSDLTKRVSHVESE